MENTEIVERLIENEQRGKSNTKRLDEHDTQMKDIQKDIIKLKETNSILKNMDFRIGNVEDAVDKISTKLDDTVKEKGKKWDKLIDYLFYALIAVLLGLLYKKLGV